MSVPIAGYIEDELGNPIRGYAGISDANGSLLAEDDTDVAGYFELLPAAGQYVFFGADGYVDKLFRVTDANSDLVVVLKKQNYLLPVGMIVTAAYVVYKGSAKKVGALDVKKDLIPLFWLAGGVIGFTVIKKLLEKVGLWQDADAKQLDAAATDPNSFWSPNFWKTSQNYSYTIDTATAQALAKQLYDCFGIFNDDEDTAIGVFRGLKTKANVSFLADQFSQLYGADLLTWLRGGLWPQDRLSDADVNTINKLVSGYPDY